MMVRIANAWVSMCGTYRSEVNKDLRHKAKAKDTADKTKAKASKKWMFKAKD